MSAKLKAISDRVKDDIDKFSVRTLTDEHRTHLGASIIGNDCNRYIWYAFRWAKFEIFSGRMLRLFERGHLEELRWIKNLEGIGFKVWTLDPATGKQFRIMAAQGHYGGSTDSVAESPYKDFTEPMICEFKTHNTKSFSHLCDKKLLISKPKHYAQMVEYGRFYNIKYGMYCATNKNDDDIYIEIVELDYRLGADLNKKAEDIITSHIPPPKISLQPSYFECLHCPYAGPCHRNEPIERNCRSCNHAWPADNGEWYCDFYKGIIPKDFIPKGCDNWQSIV